jgi:hypothetical protein
VPGYPPVPVYLQCKYAVWARLPKLDTVPVPAIPPGLALRFYPYPWQSLVEQHALDNTTCGGVKAASIAGAIFNHKDDKKGQQHTFSWWCQNHGIPSTFPDTSNTRYGSHCDAAAVLIQNC